MGTKQGKTVGVYERPPKSRRTLYFAIAIAVLLVVAGLFFFSQPASASSASTGDTDLGDEPLQHVGVYRLGEMPVEPRLA